MFDAIDQVTKEALDESGEMQRVYLVTRAFNEVYDHYVEKHKERFATAMELHTSAELSAFTLLELIFGKDRP